MPSVLNPPRLPAHAVVSHSRPPAAALGLLLALGSWSLEARAAPAAVGMNRVQPDPPAAAPAPPPEPVTPPREESYRGLLTASYVLAPLAALGVGHMLSEAEADDTLAVLGAGSMFFAPAAVHMANGNVGHGPLAFLGLAASTGVGTLLGGVVGYNLALTDCDPDEDSDGCTFAGLGGLILGAVLGGVTGYTGFAIYDVSANGAVTIEEEPPAGHASLQLWLSPLPAVKREQPGASGPFGGLQIGATLQM